MGWVRRVRMGSRAICKALITIDCRCEMGSFGVLRLGTRAARAGRDGRHGTATREVIWGNTCLPTIIISDMARGLIVKPFVYNEKSREMGFSREGFWAGIQTAEKPSLEKPISRDFSLKTKGL